MRRSAIVAVTCALSGMVAGAAQAGSTSLSAALITQQKRFDASPAAKLLRSHIDVTSANDAKSLAQKFTALQRLVEHATTVVGNASASTATQKRAQKKIVAGLNGEASGIGMIDNGLKQFAAGHEAEAKASIVTGEKTVSAADVVERGGVKMLGISTSAD